MEDEKRRCMIFIDGNNVYHNYKHYLPPNEIDFHKLSELICKKLDVIWIKSFYYNSMPDIRDSEIKYHKHEKFISGLKSDPKFFVKTRPLQTMPTVELIEKRKKLLDSLTLCKQCRPLIAKNCIEECIGDFVKKEKGIDALIVTDMIRNTLIEDNCDFCILVSGDADFIPPLELIRKKKKIFVITVRKGFSGNLRKRFSFICLDNEIDFFRKDRNKR